MCLTFAHNVFLSDVNSDKSGVVDRNGPGISDRIAETYLQQTHDTEHMKKAVINWEIAAFESVYH